MNKYKVNVYYEKNRKTKNNQIETITELLDHPDFNDTDLNNAIVNGLNAIIELYEIKKPKNLFISEVFKDISNNTVYLVPIRSGNIYYILHITEIKKER